MGNNNRILQSLLRAILENWNHDEVRAALDKIATQASPNAHDADRSHRAHPEKRRRPTASEQVEHADAGEAQKALLRDLAARFDGKQFLPTTSDAKEFLVSLGTVRPSPKDRSEAFRHILDALLRFSEERLAQLARSSLHSGPTQLAPLSDAISSAAASIQRRHGRKEELEPDAVKPAQQRHTGTDDGADESATPRREGSD